MKPLRCCRRAWELESPPTRGRGLKLTERAVELGVWQSPPTRGRGLKLVYQDVLLDVHAVAPHAGARIETSSGWTMT